MTAPADDEFDFAGLGDAAARDVAPGDFFGPYELLAEVGVGGVARVMRARHIHPRYADQDLVLKLVHPELASDSRVVGLFRREAALLALLRHPNLVRTFEAGEQDGRLFIAMQRVDGGDLEALLAAAAAARLTLPVALAVHVCLEVLAGLAYAHALADGEGRPLGLVHRDVTPGNVFLSRAGDIMLGDFGVAALASRRRAGPQEIAGKVGYFAPEQLAGAPVDARADVFAAGAMLYELLCGVGPFAAASDAEMLDRNRRAEVVAPHDLRPDLDPALERVLLRALARRPGARFVSAAALAAALRALVPPTPGARLGMAALVGRLLPAPGASTSMAPGPGELAATGTGGATVCLVAADVRTTAAVTSLLTEMGVACQPCAEPAALAAALAARPAAVVVDLTAAALLPALALALGRDRPADARAGPPDGAATAAATLVALAATLDPTTLRAAASLGADDLVLLPPSRGRLIGAVSSALRQGAARMPPSRTLGDAAARHLSTPSVSAGPVVPAAPAATATSAGEGAVAPAALGGRLAVDGSAERSPAGPRAALAVPAGPGRSVPGRADEGGGARSGRGTDAGDAAAGRLGAVGGGAPHMGAAGPWALAVRAEPGPPSLPGVPPRAPGAGEQALPGGGAIASGRGEPPSHGIAAASAAGPLAGAQPASFGQVLAGAPLLGRLLAVGLAPADCTALAAALAPAGIAVAGVATLDAAVAQLSRGSFEMAAVAAPDVAAALLVVRRLRGQPGIALLPCVLLLQRGPGWRSLPRRVLALAAAAPPATIAAAALGLHNDLSAGRTFQRVAGSLPARLRASGRTCEGAAEALSRGGVSLACPLTPNLGAGVGLTFTLPGRLHPVEASGRVITVAVDRDARTEATQVGISFSRFLGDGEPAWIAYIADQVARGAVL